MNNICVIPARCGSKRIKNKNLKFFFKKPLIYWSIKTALKSKLFKEVIVSTDDKKRLFNKTQNYKPVYHDAGQLYWGKHKNYLKYKDFRKIYLNNKSIGFVMNEKEVQDIDTIEDLNMARIKFLFNKKKLA